jgi:hypothetical protein
MVLRYQGIPLTSYITPDVQTWHDTPSFPQMPLWTRKTRTHGLRAEPANPLTRVRAPSCTGTRRENRERKKKNQCLNRETKRKGNGSKCSNEHLPTHQKFVKQLEFWLRQWFGERICKLQIGVNLLHHDTSILNRVTEMMPFYSNMLRTRTKLIGFIG